MTEPLPYYELEIMLEGFTEIYNAFASPLEYQGMDMDVGTQKYILRSLIEGLKKTIAKAEEKLAKLGCPTCGRGNSGH